MIAEELINHMIPPLKLGDDTNKAILWMEELRCNQLPVVDNGEFSGLLTEDIILEYNDVTLLVKDYELTGQNCTININSHFYDVIKVAAENKVQLVGVLDDEDKYSGVITVQDTITAFAQSAAVQLPGGIIVLSMPGVDYTLSEISRLVEENNAKILSSSVKDDPLDPNKLKLTIKINKLDLSHIVATLERFGYKIIARFQETRIKEEEKEKIDGLLKYLSI
jgi:acetoin utilization protein AcuB